MAGPEGGTSIICILQWFDDGKLSAMGMAGGYNFSITAKVKRR